MPPSDPPHQATWSRSYRPSRSSTSPPRSAMVYGPGGAGDRAPAGPCPRCSNRSSRKSRSGPAACGWNRPWLVPIEVPRASTGAPSGPSRVAASRSDIEEDGLAVALEPDVEAQHGAGAAGVAGIGGLGGRDEGVPPPAVIY